MVWSENRRRCSKGLSKRCDAKHQARECISYYCSMLYLDLAQSLLYSYFDALDSILHSCFSAEVNSMMKYINTPLALAFRFGTRMTDDFAEERVLVLK